VNGFTPTQIVRGAILTCTTTNPNGFGTGCQGIKLNGLDISGSFAAANAVCNVVTGAGWSAIQYAPFTAAAHFVWNGSNWALSSASEQPMRDLYCLLGASASRAAAQRSSTRTRGQLKSVIRSGTQVRKGH
jgi:hypothetical protein